MQTHNDSAEIKVLIAYVTSFQEEKLEGLSRELITEPKLFGKYCGIKETQWEEQYCTECIYVYKYLKRAQPGNLR
jgi:hypothetical protein